VTLFPFQTNNVLQGNNTLYFKETTQCTSRKQNNVLQGNKTMYFKETKQCTSRKQNNVLQGNKSILQTVILNSLINFRML